MTHGPQIKAAEAPGGSYDFSRTFDSVRTTIQSADWAIANLETTFGARPYTGFPMFSSPDALGGALKEAGFDVLTTSNNHAMDRRERGVHRTLAVLDSLGMLHTGTYRDRSERQRTAPLILERHGLRLALLAYTYGTNGIPITKGCIVDTINREQIAQDLMRADSLRADVKIVQMHWGQEYQERPNAAQRDLAAFLRDHGADIIIGSHPHVVQESARYATKYGPETGFVIYSMGNFVSNQNTPVGTRGGMLLTLQLTALRTADQLTLSIIPRYQYLFVQKRTSTGQALYQLRPIDIMRDDVPSDLPAAEQQDWARMARYYRRIHLAP